MTEVDKQSRRAAGRSPVLDKDVESKGQENYPCSQGPRPSTGERWGGENAVGSKTIMPTITKEAPAKDVAR